MPRDFFVIVGRDVPGYFITCWGGRLFDANGDDVWRVSVGGP